MVVQNSVYPIGDFCKYVRENTVTVYLRIYILGEKAHLAAAIIFLLMNSNCATNTMFGVISNGQALIFHLECSNFCT